MGTNPLMSRSKLFTRLFVALLTGAALWYVWMIIGAKLELGGDSPGQQQIGVVKDTRLRAMQSYCTGVVATAQGTWLIGREQGDAGQVALGAEVVDLDALVNGQPREGAAQEEPADLPGLLFRRDRETSFISRLDAQGQFQPVAHVSGAACLVASAEGNRLFLLTGLDRPEAAKVDGITQTAVFRSDDQGKHWTWLDKGWFPEADWAAWSLKPYFYGNDEVWAWGKPGTGTDEFGQVVSGPIPTGVFYSSDGGLTSTPIMAAESLLVPAEYPQGKRPDISRWHTDLGAFGEVQTHVVQLDAERAVIWVSQMFLGSHPGGVGDNVKFNVTTRAQLQRQAGQWRVSAIQRDDQLYVVALKQNVAGRVIGLVEQGDSGQAIVAELDTANLAWQPLGDLPGVFGPLPADNRVRPEGFWVGQGSLLINTFSEHRPPRWLYWWSDASISGDGVFYSNDWGKTWNKLALDGYLGVLGFQPEQDRVFWSKGYSADGGIYSYGLR